MAIVMVAGVELVARCLVGVQLGAWHLVHAFDHFDSEWTIWP